MKNLTITILLLLPFLSFTQSAFEDTKILIEHEDLLFREDLDTLLKIYTQYTDFDIEEKGDVVVLVRFVKDPFGYELNYDDFFPESIESLKEEIISNQQNKYTIAEEDYHLLLECEDRFPEDYNVYLEDDKIILDDISWNCYQIKFLEKYPPEAQVFMASPLEDSDVMSGFNVADAPIGETAIIDATAQFLVDRVKEELLLAFFDRFLSEIDQSVELTSLMPNTYFLLKNNDVFKVPSMGEVWVTAFEEDLKNIPDNFEKMVMSHPQYAEAKHMPRLQLFLMGSYVYQQSKKGIPALETLESFYTKFQDSDLPWMRYLNVLDLVQENVQKDNGSGEWIDKDAYKKVMGESETAATYFSAIIYHQDRPLFNTLKIPVSTGQSFVLGSVLQSNVLNFTQKVGELFYVVNQLSSSSGTLEKSESIFHIFDYAVELVYFSKPEYYFTTKYYQLYRPVAFQTFEAFEAARSEDYGQLLIKVAQMIEPLANARVEFLENRIAANPTLPNKQIKKEIKVLKGVVKNLVYYGGFMVDVLTATNPTEIKGVIEKYAAPVGSYRVKRQSTFSASLSAHPGFYGGWESTYSGTESQSFVTGVTAPIGLSLNWGNSLYGIPVRNHSFSLYVPIIDIGAAFSYRWKNDANVGFPEQIQWEQVLSPGVHAVWGIGNSPMALMVGAQYTPLLRKITDSNNELQPNAWRLGAAITVDIPMVHFYRSKSKF